MFTHKKEIRLISWYSEMCESVCDWLIFSNKGLLLVDQQVSVN